MESLRSNFNDLVKQTLPMESVLDPKLKSQPLSNREEYAQTLTDADFEENLTDAPAEKSKDFSTNDKKIR